MIEIEPETPKTPQLVVQAHEIRDASSRKICREEFEYARMINAGVSSARIVRPVPVTLVTRVGDPLHAFRPRAVTILNHPERWLVYDIAIGNRSQWPRDKFMESLFSPPILGASLFQVTRLISFETAQHRMDIEIRVVYVGPEDDGEVCELSWTGLASLPAATRNADGSIHIED